MKMELKVKVVKAGWWLVRSFSTKGKWYGVRKMRLRGKVLWTCGCPAWVFHRGARADCKHIAALRKALRQREAAAA